MTVVQHLRSRAAGNDQELGYQHFHFRCPTGIPRAPLVILHVPRYQLTIEGQGRRSPRLPYTILYRSSECISDADIPSSVAQY